MDQSLITSKDFTQTVAVLHCIILQGADEIHLFCTMLSSVNARGTHLSQTLGSCTATTMICCTVPRPDAVHCTVTRPSVRTISSTRAVLTSVIQALSRPLRLTSVTLSLSDAKMLGILLTRCLDVTSLPYTSESCRCVLADDSFCTR